MDQNPNEKNPKKPVPEPPKNDPKSKQSAPLLPPLSAEEEKRKKNQEAISKILAENKRVQSGRIGSNTAKVPKDIKAATFTQFLTTAPNFNTNEDLNGMLEIFPDEVIFKDIMTSQTYEINIVVRNLARTSKRIRVYQPKTSKFRCDYLMLGAIGPGLAIQLVVSFESNTLGDFHDVLKVVSEDNVERDISLHALAPQANIIFDPFVNIGFVQVGKEKSEIVNFKNEGSTPGKVTLTYGVLPDFRIEPNPQFVLQPGEVNSVRLIYHPKEAGIFRGLIDVVVEGQSFMKHIDVNATSVEFTKSIIDEEGAELTNVNFGNLFFGSTTNFKGHLINNSPKKISYYVTFIRGIHSNIDEYANLITPYDEGLEQTERVMTIEPQSGFLDAYSQIPLKFVCKSTIEEDHRIWTRNYSIAKEEMIPLEKQHEYTAIFHFDERNDRKSISLTANSICPRVRFEKSIVEFGECPQYDRRDITTSIENKHDDMEMTVSCPNVSHFFASPKKIKLSQGQEVKVDVTFMPKNLGKFSQYLNFIINGCYDIPIKFSGVCNSIGKGNNKKRGPLATPSDFEEVKKFVSAETGNAFRVKKVSNVDKMIMTTVNTSSIPDAYNHSNFSENLDQWHLARNNKKKYNDYLRNERQARLKAKEKEAMMEVMRETQERIHANFGGMKGSEDDLDEQPINYEYLFKPEKAGLEPPPNEIPKHVDTLYVTRPIAQYEPYSTGGTLQKGMDMGMFQVFSGHPKSHSEVRDTAIELSGEMLQRILVGPVLIDFGRVYIHSTVSKVFQVKNDLRTAILVKFENEYEELESSNFGPQIIPSGKCGGFKIVFCSHNLPNNLQDSKSVFDQVVSYSVNQRHHFKIKVRAEVVPVCLRFENNKAISRLFFSEDSLEMEARDYIVIENPGNDVGHFEWGASETKCFSVDPPSGEVKPGQKLTCNIIYTPRLTGAKPGGDEEVMKMKVKWGEDQTIKLIGVVTETKCDIRPTSFEFGEKPVSQKYTEKLEVKNRNPKYFAVYKVTKLPKGVEVRPMHDRIPPERSKEIEVSYISNEVKTVENEMIEINVRGSGVHKIPFSVKTIIPSVYIVQPAFDFEAVTFGNTATLDMTLVNESQIPCTLILNLKESDDEREKPGYGCLQIEDATGEDDHKLIEEKDDNEESLKNGFEGSMGDLDEDSEDGLENKAKETGHSRVFEIHLEPQKTYQLKLKFTPFDPQLYAFNLPLTLKHHNGRIEALTRRVTCKGLPPKFMMDTQNGMVEFQKRIISSNEIAIPDYKFIDFSNPDIRKPLKWSIGTSEIDEKKIFSIIPTDGRIDPQQTTQLKAGFKPLVPGIYTQKVPIYLDDDLTKPYCYITLKGEGDVPKLMFDRKEIILPVVPLDIEAICNFTIYNEGYQSVNLTAVIAEENFVGKVPVRIHYPEGKTLGVNSKSVRVQAIMKTDKAISFTTKVSFKDDKDVVYSIFVSGTADNSIFTNFPFFQRCGDEYEIVGEKNKPLSIIHADEKSMEEDSIEKTVNYSKAGSTFSRTGKNSSLGYSQIPGHALGLSCDHAKRWLNYNLLLNPIQNFPLDIVQANGSQIFDLIEMLTKKPAPGKAKIEIAMKKSEKVQKLHEQYAALIHFLKQQGALLNTIRPEFLLSAQEYQTFVKSHQKDFEHVLQRFHKVNEAKFSYISADAWLTLFYQILKLFLMPRINIRTVKAIMNDNFQVPDYYLQRNPVYSNSEILLLRWMEYCYESIYYGTEKRLKNFDIDIRDGTVLGTLLQFYADKLVKASAIMRKIPQNEEDVKFNVDRLKEFLQELGLLSYMEVKDLYSPSGREFILYLMFLFQMVPHYRPKEKIVFSCMLDQTATRTITLTNPLNKPISYYVTLNAYRDFKIAEPDSFIRLDARAQKEFKVSYTARLSKAQEGIIMFRNQKESQTNAAPLVFELASNVIGRESRVKWVMNVAPLYEMQTLELEVKNPFETEVDFIITLENVSIKAEEAALKNQKKKNIKGNRPQNQKGKNIPKEKEAPEDIPGPLPDTSLPEDYPPAFFIKTERVKLKKLGMTRIPVYYMPMTYENHKCFIIFRDEKVGEMQHEIIGTPQPPAPIRIPPCSIYIESPDPIDVPVFPSNSNQIKGLQKVMEKLRETRKENLRDVFQKAFPSLPESVTFEVEVEPPNFVIAPHSFTIVSGLTSTGASKSALEALKAGAKKKEGTGASADLMATGSQAIQSLSNLVGESTAQKNTLQLLPQFKTPVRNAKVTIGLKNSSKTDVRIYELDISVQPKVVRATLEFRTHAGTPIKQEIPIINPLENADSTVKIIIDREKLKHPEAWDIPTENIKLLKKQPMKTLTIGFKPEWILAGNDIAEAKITLQNTTSYDTYEYDLKGYADEPYPERHIELSCKARTSTEAVIPLPQNTTPSPITYRIETDLIGVHGLSERNNLKTVHPGESGQIKFTIKPLISGDFLGSVTLYDTSDSRGKYIWYTVLVKTKLSQKKDTIQLSCQVRKKLVFNVELDNPLKEPATLQVRIHGEALSGDQTFTISPGHSGIYDLEFAPLRAFKGVGSVFFMHEKLGEIWYEFNLCGEEAPAERIGTLKAELGKVAKHTIMLDNPSPSEAHFTYRISNPQNFDVSAPGSVIPAYTEMPVELTYIPSDLDRVEQGEVHFESPEIGNWLFLIFGTGLPPTVFPAKEIWGSLNKDFSSTLKFKNPFKDPITVEIRMESDDHEVFDLLLKKLKVTIPALSTMEIPFSFIPREIRDYYADVIVTMNERISWKYPIKGITESITNEVYKSLKAKARGEKVEDDFVFPLPGVVNIDPNEEYQYLITAHPSHLEGVIRKWLILEPKKTKISNENEKLEYHAVFLPMKPFKASVDLMLFKNSGGRWRFKIHLEATPPEEDDFIQISSRLNVTRSVKFNLFNNNLKKSSPFTATFSHDSAAEFSVNPKSGELKPKQLYPFLKNP